MKFAFLILLSAVNLAAQNISSLKNYEYTVLSSYENANDAKSIEKIRPRNIDFSALNNSIENISNKLPRENLKTIVYYFEKRSKNNQPTKPTRNESNKSYSIKINNLSRIEYKQDVREILKHLDDESIRQQLSAINKKLTGIPNTALVLENPDFFEDAYRTDYHLSHREDLIIREALLYEQEQRKNESQTKLPEEYKQSSSNKNYIESNLSEPDKLKKISKREKEELKKLKHIIGQKMQSIIPNLNEKLLSEVFYACLDFPTECDRWINSEFIAFAKEETEGGYCNNSEFCNLNDQHKKNQIKKMEVDSKIFILAAAYGRTNEKWPKAFYEQMNAYFSTPNQYDMKALSIERISINGEDKERYRLRTDAQIERFLKSQPKEYQDLKYAITSRALSSDNPKVNILFQLGKNHDFAAVKELWNIFDQSDFKTPTAKQELPVKYIAAHAALLHLPFIEKNFDTLNNYESTKNMDKFLDHLNNVNEVAPNAFDSFGVNFSFDVASKYQYRAVINFEKQEYEKWVAKKTQNKQAKKVEELSEKFYGAVREFIESNEYAEQLKKHKKEVKAKKS